MRPAAVPPSARSQRLLAAKGPVVRRLRPQTVYLLYSGAEGFSFRLMATIFSVFLIVELGLDPLQLLLMGTVLEGTYLLFEIPTGVVAEP